MKKIWNLFKKKERNQSFSRIIPLITLLIGILIAGQGTQAPRVYASTTGVPIVPFVVDNFNDNLGSNTGFTGNDGMVNWSGDWVEIGENDGSGAGGVQVVDSSEGRLAIVGASRGASRSVDLSGIDSASNIQLIVEYRIHNALLGDAELTIAVDDGNGGGWVILPSATISGATSTEHTQLSVDITGYATANTQIRLLSDVSNDINDRVSFRYVAITYPDAATRYCYVVADKHNDSGSDDLLTIVNRDTGNEAPIGSETGTYDIEAVAFQPGTQTLYAANAGDFGTIDLETGVFTSIGSVGTGGGAEGNIPLNDIDSLSFDPFTGILYGVDREAHPDDDRLLQIDPTTGGYVPNAFGTNIDYITIPSEGIVNWNDIDDIAVSSYDGLLYAIANADGNNDQLVTIDKITAAISLVGSFGVEDMEGLSFDVAGALFGTTGDNFGDSDSLYDIDAANGVASDPHSLTAGTDYEASDCLTWGTNDISGTVYHDEDFSQTLDGGEPLTSGVTVELWRDTDGDGVGDILLATVDTNGNGYYDFGFADGLGDISGIGALGDFVINIDTSDLPTDHTLTTDNQEVASFITVGNSDDNNNFGHADGILDFGDLPPNYSDTLLADDGARHNVGSLYLGSGIASETEGQPHNQAVGESDTATEGVTRDMNDKWINGNVVDINIDLQGSTGSGTADVGVWIDWNNDGIFDVGEFISYSGLTVGSITTVQITVPDSSVYTVGDVLNVRVRAFDPAMLPDGSLDSADYIGFANNGEVEDYQWDFSSPTAVSFQNLHTSDNTPLTVEFMLVVGFMLSLGITAVILRRRQYR